MRQVEVRQVELRQAELRQAELRRQAGYWRGQDDIRRKHNL